MSNGARSSLAPLSTLLIVIAATGGFLFVNRPLESTRPAKPDQVHTVELNEERIDARLWQDPFGGTLGPGDTLSSDELSVLIATISQSNDSTLVLAIYAHGGPYAEDRELRLRSRYALVTALGSQNLIAKDAEHIGAFLWRSPWTCGADSVDGDEVPIRFEWFEASDRALTVTPYARVLVLWLNDHAFSAELVCQLNGLRTRFASSPLASFSVVGPTQSSTIREILSSDGPTGGGAVGQEPIALYSPWSTAAEDFLLHGSDAGSIVEGMKRKGVAFHSEIARDDKLATELIRELGRRAVDRSEATVLLVSEWDTFYGRALRESMQDALDSDSVHRVRYLRGIDGATSANGTAKDSEGDKRNGDSGNRISTSELAKPIDESQLDYLRRKGDGLARGQRNKVHAVGVLGSDVYDKLLILQALRPKYPHAVFFTTDLDARLFQRDQYRWTRNLIVASGYGLNPDSTALPFRASYQTSVYRSCLAALGGQVEPRKSEVRLFEIGRTRAVEITPIAENEDKALGFLPWPSWPAWSTLAVVALLLFPVVLFPSRFRALLLLGGGRWSKPYEQSINTGTVPPDRLQDALASSRSYDWKLIGLGAASAISVVTITALAQRTDGNGVHEPMLWIEGVSIWPTQFIRILGIALTAYLILRASRELHLNLRETTDIMQLPAEGASMSRWLTRWQPRLVGPADHRRLDIEATWREYRRLCSRRSRFQRILVFFAAVAFIIAILVVIVYFNDRITAPYRGDLARDVNTGTAVVAVLAMILLTLYVHDAIRCLVRLVNHLADHSTKWPPNKVDSRHKRLPAQAWAAHLDIRLIARRSRAVDGLIYYPFFSLFVFLVAHNTYFDGWYLSPLAAVAVGGFSLSAVVSVLSLRRSAERARAESVSRMHAELLLAKPEDRYAIEKLIERAQSIEEGAFRPLSRHPVIAAVFVPFSGLGVVALLEIMATT